jgi:uncharacterized protein
MPCLPPAAMNRIDARRVAAEGRVLTGATPLNRWPRAAESVVDPSAAIEWQVTGGADDLGRPQLQIELHGFVDVTCQRCLLPMRLALDQVRDDMTGARKTSVLLASNERELEAWDEEVEDAEVVLAREPIDLDELLEDEFLLSLPFSPMCDDPACPRRAGIDALEHQRDDSTGAEKQSPFAVLRDRLKPEEPLN